MLIRCSIVSVLRQVHLRPMTSAAGAANVLKSAPLSNVKIVEGKPVWGKNCTHCMACICHCPTEAIEYGAKSTGKPRFHLEDLDPYA